ncbi:MAG: prephenate dehydrogenase/arogenate dehydrogenase family protein [Gammaproteobacteria bacterium]|nr:prephenate dehydrogenase/arogenate dehydrogenase family protein [Gammaproteobacteria bacterium]MCI0590399.1 prephenate dehydrogenase/arogenate dehydrogenase family protein [Gammaproteobacteria bacterium]
MIGRLAIIGVGLIGGSLARALKRARACEHVIGCARNQEGLKKAMALGVIDEFAMDVGSATEGADMVVVATPLGTTEAILKSMAGHLHADALVTDVGSAKATVAAAARKSLDRHLALFVPGHPVAGTEKSGVEASFAELFEGHRVILTPLLETDPKAVQRVQKMWEKTGAEVIMMDVERHDKLLAATSHLPHTLAYSLVDCLAQMDERADIFRFAAGGFADFTRIASSSPSMWHDICLANRDNLLEVIEQFSHRLEELKDALREADSNALMEMLTRAKAARDVYAANCNSQRAPGKTGPAVGPKS